MRNFFIRAFDVLIAVIAILMIIGTLVLTYFAFTGGTIIQGLPFEGGPISGLMMLVGGLLFTIIQVGFLYIGTGIYMNTKRTAEAVETMLSR